MLWHFFHELPIVTPDSSNLLNNNSNNLIYCKFNQRQLISFWLFSFSFSFSFSAGNRFRRFLPFSNFYHSLCLTSHDKRFTYPFLCPTFACFCSYFGHNVLQIILLLWHFTGQSFWSRHTYYPFPNGQTITGSTQSLFEICI